MVVPLPARTAQDTATFLLHVNETWNRVDADAWQHASHAHFRLIQLPASVAQRERGCTVETVGSDSILAYHLSKASSGRGNMFSLQGKVALVTGASRGLGWAMAQSLAKAGAHVILNARDAFVLQERADQLQAQGASAEPAATSPTTPRITCIRKAPSATAA